MTPDHKHIAGLELARETLNHWPVTGLAAAKLALDQLITQAKSTPEPVQGEAVEIVAYMTTAVKVGHLRPHKALNYLKSAADSQQDHWFELDCSVSTDELMTVAQHRRIMAAAKPDAELVELLAEARKSIVYKPSCQDGAVVQCSCEACVLNRIDAKLAELRKGEA